MATRVISGFDTPVSVFQQVGSDGVILDTTVPAEVVGSIADSATDSGKPVKIGAVANSSPPTYTSGQRANLQTDTRGNLKVTLANAAAVATVGSPSAFGQAAQAGLYVAAASMAYNGATYDLAVKPNTVSRLLSAAATTNSTVVKGSAGNLYRIRGYNAAAALRYLKFYNKATAPTVGTDVPVMTIAIPPSASFEFDVGGAYGHYFATGIGYALTVNAADADTTALTAGDITCLNITYA